MYHFINFIEGIPLVRPLKVKVLRENNEYLSIVQDLNLYAKSDDLNETIEELKEDLKNLYQDLFNSDYIPSGNAVKLKKEFEKILK
ncbi:hypothetical protein [Flavobacterium cerinum]|uniref:Uncharacterized protein n=1 Tax=Flavobacterium cerinum TaxID=2502784 RepID=A0ABY5IWW8_9FLAO|nr:hypothetical protein [Flavobacterium cerinum]UUC45992.1 hypothetical protein NOX80_02025 [Flavobacterium cerinum]